MGFGLIVCFIWSKELFGYGFPRRENERQSFGGRMERNLRVETIPP
jgi:hypothetical protein